VQPITFKQIASHERLIASMPVCIANAVKPLGLKISVILSFSYNIFRKPQKKVLKMPMCADSADVLKELPLHLTERIRLIQDAPLRPDGEFVLYWMHHAVRSHENPALDTALCMAAEFELPVLVYQGLGGWHPFNSDRHHAFIMEGVREVQQRLQERQILHVFYLGRHPTRPSPLKELAERSALVVTED
jgi:hypothetical protein